MFDPRRASNLSNRSANRIVNLKFKRSLLLPLLIVMALVGVVFSGVSPSVHSSDAVEQSAKTGVAATNARGGNNPAGFVRAKGASSSPSSTDSTQGASAAGNEQAASGGDGDQASLNHAKATPNFLPALVAPTITATKVDALVNDDGDNKIDPTNGNSLTEERITYTVTITNSGTDATHLKFTDTIDPHTTLVAGSVNTQPIASADTYSASGNIPLSLNVAGGVLANDIDPDNGSNTGLTVTEVQGAGANVGAATNTTATGRGGVKGSVTLAADGSFTYEPPPGFEGADTFTYKTSDGTSTDTATVTINISGMVWFIQNNAGGSNRGTFSNPFTTIASFNTANTSGVAPDAKNGDFIALRTGTGSYSETDGVNLRNTQKLIGNAIQFNTVFTAAANSSSAYTTFAGAAGSAPTISTSGGNGVDLADSNTVRGLNIAATSAFKINGGAVGSPVINTINLTGAGGAINVTTSGAFGANVTFATLESTSSAASNINLVSVTGTVGVTSGGTGLAGSAASFNALTINGGSVSMSYPGNMTKAANLGSLVNVSGGHSGTLTFTGTLSATSGDGIQFSNADGTYNFNGTTTLNGGDAGIDVTTGSFGTFTFNSNTSITNPTNEAIVVSGGGQTFTYSGSFSKSNGTRGILIQSNTAGTILFDGPSATETKSISSATTNAIDLLSNSGTTINFTNNNLVLTTTSGAGLNATGGGTVTVQGTGNTITTTTGTALNFSATNIGLSGLTFLSINSNGGTNGIVLNNTGTTAGTNGGLSVTGTGSTSGSGGTIQSKDQGAVFTSTINLSLKNMNFTNANTGDAGGVGQCDNTDPISGGIFNLNCKAAINLNTVTTVSLDNLFLDRTVATGGEEVGINGRNVSGLTILNSTVQNYGDEVNEGEMRLFNLTGTCAFTNSAFKNSSGRNVEIRNASGTLNLTISSPNSLATTNSIFDNTQAFPATGADGLEIKGLASTVNMTIDITNTRFLRNITNGLQVIADNSANVTANVKNCHFDRQGGTGKALDFDADNNAVLKFNVNANPIMNAGGGAGGTVANFFADRGGKVEGHIRDNPSIVGGGVGFGGSGIVVQVERWANGVVDIHNNTVSGIEQDSGINCFARARATGDPAGGRLDATIDNNNVTIGNAAAYDIVNRAGGGTATDANTVCGNVHNNTTTRGAGAIAAFQARVANTNSALILQGFTTNEIITWNNNSNTPINDVDNFSAESATGGTCNTPTNAIVSLDNPFAAPREVLAQADPIFVDQVAAQASPDYSNYSIKSGMTVTNLAFANNTEAMPASLASLDSRLAAELSNVEFLFMRPINEPVEESPLLATVDAQVGDDTVSSSNDGAAEELATAQAADSTTTTTPLLATTAETTSSVAQAESRNVESNAIALAHADNTLAQSSRASATKNPKALQLSHAIRIRTRTPALAAAALVAGETVTVDGGAGTGNTGFTLPAGKSITVTFQVTLNNLPNVTFPYPTGGPQVSNQGTVTADSIAAVLTDDPAPPAPLSNGATDPTVTFVDLFNSQTSVISSNPSSSQGDNVTFTATVSLLAAGSPSGTPGTPTGTVDFFDGTAIPANAIAGCSARPLDPSGVATCTTSAITPAGSPHTITARYNGDGNFDPSSGTTPQTVIACSSNPIVTSTADSGANTLRDALANVCNAPSNNITFNLGAGAHTITALSTLVIAKNANITNTIGAGNGPVTITANGGNFNVFRVDSPVTSASISNLTVTGANATGVNGGGLLVQSGTVTLTGMLFTGNTVINGDGGGVAAGSGTTLNLRNSTISGNTARNGGGIFGSGATLNLLNVTVTLNNANGNTGTGACPAAGSVSGAGGGLRNPSNDTNATNTIIAGNTACSAAADASGAFATLNSSLIGGDRRLAALADNGGATRTHALLSDSPALDAGDNCASDGSCAAPFNGVTLTTDQRGTGFARKRDAADADTTQTVDIGAFEADPSVENISNKTTAEDTPLEYIFNVGDSATAFDSITASSSNTTLVPNASAVVSADTASTRKLTLTPAANEAGTTTITVTVTKTISGTPISMSDTFDLTVTEVNDAPTANTDTLSAVNEDSGLRTIPFTDLTTNDSRGPANENGQTLTITAVSNPVGGTVQINGTNVEFTPAANFAGTASFDYTVQDNGTTNGVNDFKSANGSASFTVTAINDEPSFTKGADETVAEDAGAQTVNPWATGISRGGGADENGQTLTFNITNNTNTALFSVQPAVSDTGVLTYTPAANAFGTATITLELQDNGGTAGGGDDTSPTQTFDITVTPVADTPSVTNATTTVNTQTTSGLVISVNAADSGEVTHFKITNIQNGTLYQNNGTTQINDGDFITVAEGNAGLKFTPATDSTATGSFDVQAATDGIGSGLSGTASATITVSKNGTTTDVTSSSNPSYNNQTVTFTATVTSNTAFTGPPTGTVDFLEGVTVICDDVALDGTGKATCQINTLTSAGSPYNITAVYSGDSAFDTSTSSGLSQQVLPNLSVTVNMTSDAADANVGDGVCDTDLGTAGDQCTLRAALQETNSVASDDIIGFSIPTSDPGYDSLTGVYTITLSTALPDISGNVEINGLGANVLTVKRSTAGGTPDFRIFTILSGKTVTLFGLTMTNGNVSGDLGGGIVNNGTLTVSESTVSGNSASEGGGGIVNNGTLTVSESTVSGNSTSEVGGGICNSNSATITNSTVSGNSANKSGGGIYNSSLPLTVINSTITNNRADNDNDGTGTGGGIFRGGTGAITLHNTIVAGNFNEGGVTDPADDFSGVVASGSSNNLIGDGTGMTGLTNGSNGNQVGTMASPIDPRLGPLADNGGGTKTHALLPGSPALDAGSDTEANNASLVTDQRCSTHNRYVDSDDADAIPTVDIGAFEAQVSVQDIADQATNEDTQLQFNFNVSDGLSSADVTATSSDTGIVPNGNVSVTGASSPLTLTIDPGAAQFGTVTITVTVTSGGETMTDTFLLTINSVNDVPSFTKGADQTVGEDAGPQSVPGWATGISAGPANESTQTLTFMVTGNTNTALFSTQPAVSSTGTLTYTPAANANGTATITLVLQDNGGTANGGVDTSASQSFDINVTSVNDVPTADAQSVTTDEDTPKAITLSGSDVETPAGSLTFIIGTGPTNGVLSGTGANRTYTPNADYNGPDSFTFKVNDGTTDSALATVTINVTDVNDAPAAVNDTISNVAEDSAQRSIPFSDLTGNDSKGPANESGQTLTVNNVSNAVGGTVSISGSNVLFTPTANYNGPASFQYTIADNGTPPLTSAAAATASFVVTPTPDTPSVTNSSTLEDVQTTTGLVISRNPVDGPEVTHFKITGITGGVLYQNNGTTWIQEGDFITAAQGAAGLRFTPSANSEANGSFQVQASLNATNGGLGGGLVTATITVTPVNDTPTLDPISDLVINEDAPTQTVTASGITAGWEVQQITLTATSNNPGLIPNPTIGYASPNSTGTLSFAPVANQSGSAIITVTVKDNGGTANSGVDTITRTFTVTVNAVNDAPVNNVPGAQSTNRNTALTFAAANLISISDVDAGAAAVQVTLTATNGTLTLSGTAGLAFTTGDGTADATMTFTGTLASINAALSGLTFTPTANFTGAASVQISTNDQGNSGPGGPLSDTDTVNITVNNGTIQFAQANYTVGEAGGHASILVTRLGDVSQPASVDFQTGDLSGLTNCNVNTGNASPRCDLTAMAGTLNFPVGQSVAAFEIPIINDVYVEGPETLPITLSNPQGGILGAQSTATLTITDNDNSPGAPNPIDDPAFFIRLQYMDILNREPEPQGLADWLAILQNCPAGDTTCDLVEVSRGFFGSPEFFARAYYIYRFYEVGLGRKPDYDEYQRDLKLVTGFLTNAELEARKQQFAQDFSQRADFRARYDQYDSATRSQEYVDALSTTAGVTLPNRTQLANDLASNTRQRWDVLRAIVESQEVSTKFYNKAFVVIGYFAYLRRDPDAQYLVWLAQLNNPPAGKTQREIERDMIAGFIFSQEYRFRFGP